MKLLYLFFPVLFDVHHPILNTQYEYRNVLVANEFDLYKMELLKHREYNVPRNPHHLYSFEMFMEKHVDHFSLGSGLYIVMNEHHNEVALMLKVGVSF
jgi:hypothetical protein